MNHVAVVDLGRTKYADAWALQQRVFEARRSGAVPDVLLLTEHEHVYTLGKGGDVNHILAGEMELRERGIDLFSIDRGGDVTYHGPGQLVGYPILNLNNYYLDIHRYLRDIEEVLIRTLGSFGVAGGRSEGMTGVWIKSEKIAAIGVRVSRWTTMHGFALNVATDLSFFDRIIPCGIFHKGVTSLDRVLLRPVSVNEVIPGVIKDFSSVFGVTMEHWSLEKLEANLALPAMVAHEE
ncbi:MAG: lipoyl(octanoyl) transferase LipB [Ignavibacteriales bacterium]|nr:lipoyl(octanoyl) transferase LipB [Ignavibacteriales bacterium]